MDNNQTEITQTLNEIGATITDFDKNLKGLQFLTPRVLQLHAKILALTSSQADDSSRRLERQTRQLIRLTWAIAILTLVLLAISAIPLIYHR